jgi:predicted peptidase
MAIDEGVPETPEKQKFHKETFTDSRGNTLPYRLLVPTVHPANATAHARKMSLQRMPLVLVLHGSGERGNDNSAQLDNGVAELLAFRHSNSHLPLLCPGSTVPY